MSIDIETDSNRLITFNQAAATYLAELARPSCATWWRWHKKGINGVRLKTLVFGGRRYTTPRFVEEWIAQLTAAANGERPPVRTPRQHERAIKAAEAVMAGEPRVKRRPRARKENQAPGAE